MAENNGRGTGGATGAGWKPGQSGNPGGRPKGLASAIRALAPPDKLAGYFLAIWNKDEVELAKLGISLEAVTLAERNKAGEWLTDRGYGKAPQFAPVDGENPLELEHIDRRILAVLDELAAKRETKAAGSGEADAVAGAG